MTGIAEPLDELRIALGEMDVLVSLTTGAFDAEDWVGSDPDTVEGVASLLGLIQKSAAAAKAASHRVHGAIADAAPAPAGEAWDYHDGTAPGGKHAGAASAPGDEPAASARDAEVVRRLRERCAAQLGRPVDHPFFLASHLAGEPPDAALLRLFRQNRQLLGRTDDDVIAAMVPFALVHERPADPGGRLVIRAILCRIGAKPRTIYLGGDDDPAAVVGKELRCRGPVARLPLLDGVELRCDRNGLLLGLGLARRAMAAGLRALTYPRREPSPSATRPRDGHDWDLDVDLGNWAASGDFLLVRVGARGELVELTHADLGLWEVLLGLDYLLHR